ncbi:radical SAM/SPASM family putative metalloenzyme maturase [Desulfosediminicola flagellatus]|uniref:radical SAM/SPASM family putative metalloenzyme maturase n=1 Tax=Desulfosediminicola flagellatus TaxID=2569541 RepID=UPI0010ABA307|nr:radical SAM/SPASM family putative metalloenzyme maturase [Desulfosediminicola flagellatus]
MHPRKLYLETTTRCNMNCGMCVKHVPGSVISNKHLDFDTFTQLHNVLPSLDALVLNGIGEPLLHPDIQRMVRVAKENMPDASWVGFQTNGSLLNADNTRQLLNAGLGRLCISVDGLSDDAHCGGSLLHENNSNLEPFKMVKSICETEGYTNFQLGAEIVLVKETISRLPQLIEQLSHIGVDFIICSHLLAYQDNAEEQSLFNTNTTQAQELFSKWQKKAREEQIDLTELTAKTWIAPRHNAEQRLQQLYKQMLADAQEEGIWLHVKKLNQRDQKKISAYEDYLRTAQEIADRYGVELSLPPLSASTQRSCTFINENAIFVDVEGNVMPCHPLWHAQTIYMDNEPKHIQPRTFGNIADRDLLQIWHSEEYREFRQTAGEYEYPFCHSCSLGPCPDILGEVEPFANDCFGISVPCGHCLWCYDAVRCL